MELLGIFQQGQCHMALISLDPMKTLDSLRQGKSPTESGTVLGLVTMEDVLEKIIQNDIVDETDSNHNFKVFPNGGAPTIFYHQPNNLAKFRQMYGGSNVQRPKRKPKDRTPHRGSVVSSQYHGNGPLETDSECEPSYYQFSQPLEIEMKEKYRLSNHCDATEESSNLIPV
jgi:hypothetical protein